MDQGIAFAGLALGVAMALVAIAKARPKRWRAFVRASEVPASYGLTFALGAVLGGVATSDAPEPIRFGVAALVFFGAGLWLFYALARTIAALFLPEERDGEV